MNTCWSSRSPYGPETTQNLSEINQTTPNVTYGHKMGSGETSAGQQQNYSEWEADYYDNHLKFGVQSDSRGSISVQRSHLTIGEFFSEEERYATYLRSSAATMSVDFIQTQDLEGGQRRGSWLGGDHPSESSHRPRSNVVVIGTNWHAANMKIKLDEAETAARTVPDTSCCQVSYQKLVVTKSHIRN